MEEEKTRTTKTQEEADEEDISQCPVLKDKFDTLTPEQRKEMKSKYDAIVKPMLKKKREEAKEEEKKDGVKPEKEEKKSKVRKQHPRFEEFRKAQGGCPVMGAKLIEPNDETFEFGNNLKYKSRYEFIFNYRGKDTRAEFLSKRKEFDKYPIFLKHTLLHPESINRIRNADFGNAFFVFDDIKTEGNLYYEDHEYYTALDFYEQAYSCFQWLEFVDPKKKDQILNHFDLAPIYDVDIVRKEKDYKGDECEIDTRLSAVVNILLNICCVYMKLSHYSEALECCQEIARLTPLSVEQYFRRSQIRTFNLKSTYKDLLLAEEDIMVAISKKPDEQKYKKHLDIVKKRRLDKLEDDRHFVMDLVLCAKRSLEYKKSKDIATNETLIEIPQEIKIMKVMKRKYADCMEFFRDTEDLKQIELTVNEFREFSNTSYQKMMRFYKFNPAALEQELLDSFPAEIAVLIKDENIIKEINTLKVREAVSLFGEGKINFQLFQYATKLVFDEEKKKKERLAKRQKEMSGVKEKEATTSYGKYVIYGIVISILLYILWNWISWKFFMPMRSKGYGDKHQFGPN